MKLLLVRDVGGKTCTTGQMFVDEEWQCHTLEDAERACKIPGQTAIPKGKYRVRLSFSPRFQRILPLLEDVPNFQGIRIHPGNTEKDTEGCILVGLDREQNYLLHSRIAFEELFDKLKAADGRGEEITLEII